MNSKNCKCKSLFWTRLLCCILEAFLFNKRTLAASDSVLCGLIVGGRSQLGKPAIHSLLVESLRKKLSLRYTILQVSIFVIFLLLLFSPPPKKLCKLHWLWSFFQFQKEPLILNWKVFSHFWKKILKKVFDDVIVESGKCAAEKSSTIQV